MQVLNGIDYSLYSLKEMWSFRVLNRALNVSMTDRAHVQVTRVEHTRFPSIVPSRTRSVSNTLSPRLPQVIKVSRRDRHQSFQSHVGSFSMLLPQLFHLVSWSIRKTRCDP